MASVVPDPAAPATGSRATQEPRLWSNNPLTGSGRDADVPVDGREQEGGEVDQHRGDIEVSGVGIIFGSEATTVAESAAAAAALDSRSPVPSMPWPSLRDSGGGGIIRPSSGSLRSTVMATPSEQAAVPMEVDQFSIPAANASSFSSSVMPGQTNLSFLSTRSVGGLGSLMPSTSGLSNVFQPAAGGTAAAGSLAASPAQPAVARMEDEDGAIASAVPPEMRGRNDALGMRVAEIVAMLKETGRPAERSLEEEGNMEGGNRKSVFTAMRASFFGGRLSMPGGRFDGPSATSARSAGDGFTDGAEHRVRSSENGRMGGRECGRMGGSENGRAPKSAIMVAGSSTPAAGGPTDALDSFAPPYPPLRSCMSGGRAASRPIRFGTSLSVNRVTDVSGRSSSSLTALHGTQDEGNTTDDAGHHSFASTAAASFAALDWGSGLGQQRHVGFVAEPMHRHSTGGGSGAQGSSREWTPTSIRPPAASRIEAWEEGGPGGGEDLTNIMGANWSVGLPATSRLAHSSSAFLPEAAESPRRAPQVPAGPSRLAGFLPGKKHSAPAAERPLRMPWAAGTAASGPIQAARLSECSDNVVGFGRGEWADDAPALRQSLPGDGGSSCGNDRPSDDALRRRTAEIVALLHDTRKSTSRPTSGSGAAAAESPPWGRSPPAKGGVPSSPKAVGQRQAMLSLLSQPMRMSSPGRLDG